MQSAKASKFRVYTRRKTPLHLVGDEPYSLDTSEEFPLKQRLEAVKQWGEGTHSFLTLYPGVKYFRVPGVEGYIPLEISKKFILIIGQPVCAPSTAKVLLSALKYYAAKMDCTIGAVPVGEMARGVLAAAGFKTYYVGQEPLFDLKDLAKPHRSIRQAVARAKRKGLRLVTYHEKFREQIEQLCQKWELNRELPPMGFLFELHPMKLREHKKYFLVVDSHDRLKAFLACSPIYEKNGWYLEDLIRDKSAPNGCTELLVTETLKVLGMEGYDMATLGLSALSGLPEKDDKHPLLHWLLKFAFNHLSFIYHFKALEHFKTKFQPNSWEGNYFCHYRAGSSVLLIVNLLSAFVPYDLNTVIKHKLQKWRIR